MSGVCISAVGDGVTAPELNTVLNTHGVISAVSNVLDTCTLLDFGVTAAGAYCGSCCFTALQAIPECGALVMHECESGQIIDFQLPPKGMYCTDDGVVCVQLDCWTPRGPCSEPEPDCPDIDFTCADPCAVCNMLENAVIKAALGDWVTWRNADKSVTRSKPDCDKLEMLRQRYERKCQACCQRAPRCIVYRPNC